MVEINEDIFNDNSEKQHNIKEHLTKGEKILWQDKPNVTSFAITEIIKLLLGVILATVICFVFLSLFLLSFAQGTQINEIHPFYYILMGSISGLLFISSLIYGVILIKREKKKYATTMYYITNKRILITEYDNKKCIKQIDFKDIKEISLIKRWYYKLVKMGDVAITLKGEVEFGDTDDDEALMKSLEGSNGFYHIKNPEKVYKAIAQIKDKYKNLAKITADTFGLTKPKKCRYCGNIIKTGEKCPHCGAIDD